MRYVWTMELQIKPTELDRDLLEQGDTWRTLAERDMNKVELSSCGDVTTTMQVVFDAGDPAEGDEP